MRGSVTKKRKAKGSKYLRSHFIKLIARRFPDKFAHNPVVDNLQPKLEAIRSCWHLSLASHSEVPLANPEELLNITEDTNAFFPYQKFSDCIARNRLIFLDFARSHPEFRDLDSFDKMALLNFNATVFTTFLVGMFLGTSDSKWITLSRYGTWFEVAEMRDFLEFGLQRKKKVKQFVYLAKEMSRIKIDPEELPIVAHACLFFTSGAAGVTLSNSVDVSKNFNNVKSLKNSKFVQSVGRGGQNLHDFLELLGALPKVMGLNDTPRDLAAPPGRDYLEDAEQEWFSGEVAKTSKALRHLAVGNGFADALTDYAFFEKPFSADVVREVLVIVKTKVMTVFETNADFRAMTPG